MARIAVTILGIILGAGFALAQGARRHDKADVFFDDREVREIRIYFDDPNWYDTLVAAHENEATTGDPYFPCRFKYGKIDLPKVGIRFKGASSFRRNGVKRPFKFDFDEYEDDTTFLGLKKLNLHTNDLQPDFMREKLFVDFAGRFVPAVRMVHVRLYVNDVYYGLYTAMEQPDKTMMQSLFGDDEDGNLYEAPEELGGFGGMPPGGGTPPPPPPGGTPPPPPPDGTPPPINIPRADLGWLGSDPAAYYDLYQLETNEDDNDYSGLIEFLDILNNTPAADLPTRLEQVADVEELLTWMALNNLFVSLDSYLGAAAEYYLYDRDRDGRFIYVQWDHNESFGTTGDGTPLIANPFTFDVFWLPTNAGGGGGFPGIGGGPRPLLEKLWAVDDFKRLYLRIFARMLREGFQPHIFSRRIDRLANLIREDVYTDPNKVTTNEQFETSLNSQTSIGGGGFGGDLPIYGLTQFVSERYNYLRPWLNSQAQPSDVRLNELMSANKDKKGCLKDKAGNADPWLELHNLGPGPVTTENFYLTDDPANPTKWRIPTVTLADGDSIVLWLDGEPRQGRTHANFKLNKKGGQLFLYAGETQIDTVTYPELDSDESYIRLGSYGNQWSVSSQPTPGRENRIGENSAVSHLRP